jgi:hypothetical protein
MTKATIVSMFAALLIGTGCGAVPNGSEGGGDPSSPTSSEAKNVRELVVPAPVGSHAAAFEVPTAATAATAIGNECLENYDRCMADTGNACECSNGYAHCEGRPLHMCPADEPAAVVRPPSCEERYAECMETATDACQCNSLAFCAHRPLQQC